MPDQIAKQAAELHQQAIVMDMTCPLMNEPSYWQWWREGGVTVAAPSVNTGDNIRDTTQALGRWLGWIEQYREDLVHVTTIQDIYRAKQEGKLGILFHFQNTLSIERDLSMLSVYYHLGVRVVQLTYNEQNFVGAGCEEEKDAGLSKFGKAVVSTMNRLGIVVDCSHTGLKTTWDALHHSEKPIVVSHANAQVVCDNERNLPDDVISAIADQSGLVGLVGFPAFVKRGVQQPSLGDLLDHCDHICQLAGHSRSVALGLDYYKGMAEVEKDSNKALRDYQQRVDQGIWNPRNYPPPPHYYPLGLETPREFPNLTETLLRRGYKEKDVVNILGGNWLRVFQAHGM